MGYLDGIPGGVTRFKFTESYMRLSPRPVLGRRYEDSLASDFTDRSPIGLPPFFQNYLPEATSMLRSILAERAGVKPTRELELLAALGEDLPGAIVVDPVDEGGRLEDDISDGSDTPITAAAASVDPAPDGPLRFSLAGMQLKFSIAAAGEKLTLPVTGTGGRFILKLPHNQLRGVPANEHATMSWARASGITTPDVDLVSWQTVENLPAGLELDEPEAFLIERYDRPRQGGLRIHQEDFAQVFGVRPEAKYGRDARVTYDRLGRVLATVCGREDFNEFLARLVFCVLSGNPDAHLKNWSLWYPTPERPRLAPAYDLVCALPYRGVERRLACTLAKEDDLLRIRDWHFGILASHAGVPAEDGVAMARAASARARDAWTSARAGFSTEVAATLEKHLNASRL